MCICQGAGEKEGGGGLIHFVVMRRAVGTGRDEGRGMKVVMMKRIRVEEGMKRRDGGMKDDKEGDTRKVTVSL